MDQQQQQQGGRGPLQAGPSLQNPVKREDDGQRQKQQQQQQQQQHADEGEGESSTKRRAQQGQWRTPPLPTFVGSAAPAPGTAAAAAPSSSGAAAAAPPVSDDDYAKALQEAYRRGAEAGAALNRSRQLGGGNDQGAGPPPPGGVPMVVHAHAATPASPPPPPSSDVTPQPLNSAASCPNLSRHGVASPTPPQAVGEEPDPQLAAAQQQQRQHQRVGMAGAPSASSAGGDAAGTGSGATMLGVPTPLPLGPMNLRGVGTGGLAPTGGGESVVAPAPISSSSSSQQQADAAPRSVSLPDITSYAARANAEEEKRRKRLARNRASARLRRLRKKNLVDSYEGEVGVLETSLNKLKAHKWGVGADHEALIEALSMERGQQALTPEKRRDLIMSILDQQREQVHSIMECQLENMVLGWIASYPGDAAAKPRVKRDSGASAGPEEEEAALARELHDILQLTADQKSQLQKATEGTDEERRAIEAVDSCLITMRNNEWLMNRGVEEIAEQFNSILNPGQMSKFLLWTDHNSEAIDQLDYVHAPPASAPPSQGPTFVFGMDEGQHGDDGET